MGTIILNLSEGNSALPWGSCSEHGGVISPRAVDIPGRLHVVWECAECLAEAAGADMESQRGEEETLTDSRIKPGRSR